VADIFKMDKLMSHKEVKRAQVLELLKEDKISQQEAARRLDVSTRQVRRLTRRYQAAGLAGLVSKKRGSASNQRLDNITCATAIGLIGTHYRDFGPTLACEKLAERHNLHLSVESTRQMMIKAGYWRTKKGCTACRLLCTATNTASSASIPRRLIRRPKHNSHGLRGNWESNVSTPTARKPKDV